MATETAAAETFKMHTPLIGNRADCVIQEAKGGEALCECGWGGRRGALLLKARAGLEGWKRSGVS